MATNQKRTTSNSSKNKKKSQQDRKELFAIIFLIAGFYALICCFNTKAFLIAPCAKFFAGLLGQIGRYLLPLSFFYASFLLFRGKKTPILRVVYCFTVTLTMAVIYHLIFGVDIDPKLNMVGQLYRGGYKADTGGLLGGLLAIGVSKAITPVGALITSFGLLFLQVLNLMGISLRSLINAIRNRPRPEKAREEEPEVDRAERIVNHLANKHIERVERKRNAEIDIPIDDPPALNETKKKTKKSRVLSPDEFLVNSKAKQVTIDEIELQDPEEPDPATAVQESVERPAVEPVQQPAAKPVPVAAQEPEKMKKAEVAAAAVDIARQIEDKPQQGVYVFPTVELLQPGRRGTVDATAEMRENSRRLADSLKSFGIEPHIVNVIRGPAITRYELELDRGVKLSKITNLADDIALSLGATGVRISAIPDKISVVGIEVPNKSVNTVFAREVIDSAAFKTSKSKISFAVGKDISGNCIVGDIAKLPHMLIAGTTGSGKSVCMNTLILSLLYKAQPDEVKLIMIDPKMVELGVYNGIPHLLIPVVTDPKKAAGALQWTVTEMMRRYRLMSEEGVRDLESYNKAVQGDPELEPLPQIVVVIDELADLMLVAAKEVEESICRIAQMGRASGIHLVIATQRPSADVITGLMKANIPSRIAFAVSSAMESRIILDTQGAEKLVGKGDMLFAPLGQGKPKRVQGCFVTDDEVQSVVNAIKQNCSSNYSSEVMEQIDKRAEQGGKAGSGDAGRSSADDNHGDELLPAAVEVILETGQASVSMLQRRLKLGYARAARIVDEMEERGIVGSFEGAKPRQLLITKEQWQQMQNGETAPVEEEI